jgi:hypothetical protein
MRRVTLAMVTPDAPLMSIEDNAAFARKEDPNNGRGDSCKRWRSCHIAPAEQGG